jgi:hypothetical protein
VYYNKSLRIITKQASKSVYELVKKNNELMDAKFRQVEQVSSMLIIDKELYSIFKTMDPNNDTNLVTADRRVSSTADYDYVKVEDERGFVSNEKTTEVSISSYGFYASIIGSVASLLKTSRQ